MMDLDSAIRHCQEQVQEQAKRGCYSCAEEHRQLAEWLKELKAYRDARAEINQALNDDARGEQNDYERGRKSGIFLCESIISVKLGESCSEIPNTCGDAISRQAVMDYFRKWQPYMATRLWDFEKELSELPSVSPQQRIGRWSRKTKVEDVYDIAGVKTWGIKCQCDRCDFSTTVIEDFGYYKWCPNCGAKMEVEE